MNKESPILTKITTARLRIWSLLVLSEEPSPLAITPSGDSLNFVIAMATGVIYYVMLDGYDRVCIAYGGLGRPTAIIINPENGQQ
jgi:hypothetical protein